ncbi:putative 2-aminoethylphosphonate ABC transporter permease subunit [Clostridium baratii]|uniref:Iron ABC transporter permease n=1 Tax=Clostridium baratii TaxID=1561 RepID=A0A174SVS6_9CLOT|nr:iron ABC transporter permease [Clostridium baratii]
MNGLIKSGGRDYEALLKKILIIIMVTLLVVFILIPVTMLLFTLTKDKSGNYVGFKNVIEYLTSLGFRLSLKNSLFISSISTIISIILAFLYAYGIARTNIKLKGIYNSLALLPIFAPTMLYGIALIYLFGNKGFVTMNFGTSLELYGPFGIIISEIIYTFPQCFLILYMALKNTDNRLYEAAETLGTSKVKQFFYVTLPGIKYSLISAIFVAFTLSFTDFGAPKIVGGSFNVLATDIYKQVVGQNNIPMGATVGMILIIPSLLSFIIDRITNNKVKNSTANEELSPFKIKENKLRDSLFFVFNSLIALSFLTMIIVVFLAAFIKVWPYNLSLTLDHFSFNTGSGDGFKSYLNSIIVALLTAIIGTVITFINSYLIEKVKEFKILRNISYFLSIVPLSLPGLVIGISYIVFFNNPNNPFNFLYGTVAIVVIGNIVHFYSVPFISSTSNLKKLSNNFEEAAKTLNIPFYKTILKVTIPMSLEGILENFMYFFTNSMVTISAVVFLYSPKFMLATISIVNLDDAGNTAGAAALASLIIVTNIVTRIIYECLIKLIRKNKEKKMKNV